MITSNPASTSRRWRSTTCAEATRAVGRGEAAAPVVGPERLGQAVGIDLHAAVRDELEGEPVAVALFQPSAERVGVALRLVPIEEDVDADERFLLPLRGLDLDVDAGAAVVDGIEVAGLLAEPLDHGVGEVLRRELAVAEVRAVDVGRVEARFERGEPRVLDQLRDARLADVDEHHHRAAQQTRRVRHAAPGDVRGRAVNRFEHREVAPDVRRPGEPDRARRLGGDVGEDVAVEVRGDDHVERLGACRHERRADVDDPVVGLDLGVLGGDLVEDAVEEAVGELHDVVLRHARHAAAAVGAGVLEGVADDGFGAGPRDELERLRDLRRLPVLDPGVGVLLVLADDDEVHARLRGGDERAVALARANVGVHPERFAERHVEALEPAALRRRDRSLEEDAVAAEHVPRLGRDAGRVALPVHALADLDDVVVQRRPGRVEDAQRRLHDLGTDAVAVRDGDGDGLRRVGLRLRVRRGEGGGVGVFVRAVEHGIGGLREIKKADTRRGGVGCRPTISASGLGPCALRVCLAME